MTAAEVDRASRASGVVDQGQHEQPSHSDATPAWYWRRELWLVVAAVAFAAFAIPYFGRRYVFFDMKIYHGAVEWWVAGGELYNYVAPYTTLGFTYPPFAAVAMLPMAAVTPWVAGWLNAIASIAALGLVLLAFLAPIADRYGWPRWATVGVALPLALAIEPTRETLGFGQVNLLLFGLVMADLVALGWAARRRAARQLVEQRRGRRGPGAGLTGLTAGQALRRLWFSGAWAGVGIGLATAVKLTPGLFIIYLLVAKQRRPAMVATATAAGASLLTWLVAPRESTTYFGSVLWQTDRVGAADFTPNQSLAGVLARLYDSPETPGLLWLSFAALCCAVGLSRAVSAHKEGDELAAFTLVGLTATVISPISWSHHLVFIVPAVIVIVDAGLRRRSASRGLGLGSTLAGLPQLGAGVGVYLLFVMSPIWWMHHRLPEISHYENGVLGLLAENSLALCVILVVVLMPWRPGAWPAQAAFVGRPAFGFVGRQLSPGSRPATVGLPAWRRPAAGSSGSTVAARSQTSSPVAPTARS
jgi:hypothetical protein